VWLAGIGKVHVHISQTRQQCRTRRGRDDLRTFRSSYISAATHGHDAFALDKHSSILEGRSAASVDHPVGFDDETHQETFPDSRS
jgi:hypothetical protein